MSEDVFLVNDELGDDSERDRQNEHETDYLWRDCGVSRNTDREEIVGEIEDNADNKKLRDALEIF